MSLTNVQGTVVGVIHDQVLVRYESSGVIFLKETLSRMFKLDDIVQFSARKANATDIAVAEQLSRSTKYEVRYRGTEIKYVKGGRTLMGEGQILTIDQRGEFLFVDWKFTPRAPSATKIQNQSVNTNVFCTKAVVRPECTNVNDVFKVGDRIKFVAKEQAPNRKGVCWRAALVTSYENEIKCNENSSRPSYSISKPESTSSRRMAPSTSQYSQKSGTPQRSTTPQSSQHASSSSSGDSHNLEVPPRVDGFDFYDCSPQACEARYRAFVKNYRLEHPNETISLPMFEGLLQIKYLQSVQEMMQAIRAVKS